MIRSLHAPREAAERIQYAYAGVALASSLSGVMRGDRFQGQFRCSAGLLEGDESDMLRDDPAAGLKLIVGPHRLTSVGPLKVQRLVTPQFYRIAVRCNRFAERPEAVSRLSLAFYSDPRFCTGEDFRLDRLDISKIPMPSLYLEAAGGEPVLNAKLQSLDRAPELKF